MQVQSARKSNCTGCLELPETDWKLRAELSGPPERLAGLCVCLYVRAPLSRREKNNIVLSCATCLHMSKRANDMHLLPNAACVSSPGLTTAWRRPAGSLSVTVESRGPVSAITYALRSLEPSRCLGNNAAISSLLQACHQALRDTLVRIRQIIRNMS